MITPPGWHTVTTRIVTDDVAAHAAFIARVFEATGKVEDERPTVLLEAPTHMPYGDRRAMVEDRWGCVWQIATWRPAP